MRRVGELGTLIERMESYSAVMVPGAFFCGPTAALLIGMPLPLALEEAPLLHVAVPWPDRAPRGAGVVGHKYMIDPSELTKLQGLVITTAARTWCDLAADLVLPDLVAAGDWVVRSGVPVDQIAALADRHPGQRGRRRRLEAVPLLDGRAESRKETHLRVLLIRAGLTAFVPNVEVVASGYRYRLDLAWAAKRIALEYQGGYHHDPTQWQRDMTRRSRLEAAGWTVVFVSSADLAAPDELVRRIRALIALRRDAKRP
ncbi:MAG: DUF559 domain-containing protein [Micrococcales bacterium]|nr:DUF559 domain-containing protein [Micrococcales bacterium]